MFATRSTAFPANSNGAGTRSPRQRSSSDVYRAPCETQGLRPERGRIMHHVHYFPNRMDETVKLPGGYNKRWGHLENKKVIPADLRQDAVVAEEPHHNRLAEHAFVDVAERLESEAQSHLLRRLKFNPRKHSDAANFTDHLIARQCLVQSMAQELAHGERPVAEI